MGEENHGPDFAEASSYAKASADKTADKKATAVKTTDR